MTPSIELQTILMIGSVLSGIIIVNLIRKYQLELKYTMLWLILILVTIIVSIFPQVFVFISKIMGIQVPSNAVFLFVSFGCFALIFSLTLTVSKLTVKTKELTQEIGLLKLRLHQFEEANYREAQYKDQHYN